MGDFMGIFGKGAKPSKPGTYNFSWPATSGLGVRSYSDEQDAREKYLTYSSVRRRDEGYAPEDLQSVEEALTMFAHIGLGEATLLVSGPVDLRALEEPLGSEYKATCAITDRSTFLWWRGRKGYEDEFFVLHHQELQPRVPESLGFHFIWSQGTAGDYFLPRALRQTGPVGFAITPHFSADGHANRRGASAQATLQYIRGD